ncbi:MAG: RIP metalloprotease RseP [Spirochaetes bacterium GWD1_27_9]|nr:MAG: RIP metalloprotease RseP [Spirochaetes bacterium GWB1_27_13]OHD26165.1 MAG: RIP metalloprotease RseP [Spirochaetes bacterium GWC1_27_15]OHD37632.1 MAG: RIP metalloprotease RseP [Spirochaetes bacterium GWD1_27_9]
MSDIFNNFFMILVAVIGFGILVFFHELGHFVVAKMFKIKVDVFSLGWGPKLIGFKRGETLYQIALFPIGGYCKFAGDEMTTDFKAVSNDPNTFYGAKPHKRLLVALFGPLTNYIIAVIVLSILAMGTHKEFYRPNKIILSDDLNSQENKEPSPAKKAGLLTGDQIIKINNKEIGSFEELNKFMVLDGNQKELKITVKRNGEIKQLILNPIWDPSQLKAIIGVIYYLDPIIRYSKDNKLTNYLGLEDKDKIIGLDSDYEIITNVKTHDFLTNNFATNKTGVIHIERNGQIIDKQIVFNELNYHVSQKELFLDYYVPERVINGKNPISAFVKGFNDSNEMIKLSAIGLYSLIFKPKKDITNQLGGPIRIGHLIGASTVEAFKDGFYEGLRNFLSVISYISLALAFFNLLPFPAVDGGHIILNLYEMITRKPLSLKVIYLINFIGFIILISLAILVAFLDISNLSK